MSRALLTLCLILASSCAAYAHECGEFPQRWEPRESFQAVATNPQGRNEAVLVMPQGDWERLNDLMRLRDAWAECMTEHSKRTESAGFFDFLWGAK